MYYANLNENNDQSIGSLYKKGEANTLMVYWGNKDKGVSFSRFPSLLHVNETDFVTDGVFMDISTVPGGNSDCCHLGKTLVHEVGHWLGLYHTFEGNSCDDRNSGDYISDTPQQANATEMDCPRDRDSCPGVPGVDPIHNFMDYSSDDCLNDFTTGQIQRMYIVWSLYRQNDEVCNSGQTLFKIEINLDRFASEVSWQLIGVNLLINQGEPQFDNKIDENDSSKTIVNDVCLAVNKTYIFTIFDSSGDGLTPGSYKLFLSGKKIKEGKKYGGSESTTIDTVVPSSPPMPPQRTKFPTNRPTLEPTNSKPNQTPIETNLPSNFPPEQSPNKKPSSSIFPSAPSSGPPQFVHPDHGKTNFPFPVAPDAAPPTNFPSEFSSHNPQITRPSYIRTEFPSLVSFDPQRAPSSEPVMTPAIPISATNFSFAPSFPRPGNDLTNFPSSVSINTSQSARPSNSRPGSLLPVSSDPHRSPSSKPALGLKMPTTKPRVPSTTSSCHKSIYFSSKRSKKKKKKKKKKEKSTKKKKEDNHYCGKEHKNPHPSKNGKKKAGAKGSKQRKEDDNCNDEPKTNFFVSSIQEFHHCDWLSRHPKDKAILCVAGHESGAWKICSATCRSCDEKCEDSKFKFKLNNVKRDCNWLRNRPELQNGICVPQNEAYFMCSATCNSCGDSAHGNRVPSPTNTAAYHNTQNNNGSAPSSISTSNSDVTQNAISSAPYLVPVEGNHTAPSSIPTVNSDVTHATILSAPYPIPVAGTDTAPSSMPTEVSTIAQTSILPAPYPVPDAGTDTAPTSMPTANSDITQTTISSAPFQVPVAGIDTAPSSIPTENSDINQTTISSAPYPIPIVGTDTASSPLPTGNSDVAQSTISSVPSFPVKPLNIQRTTTNAPSLLSIATETDSAQNQTTGKVERSTRISCFSSVTTVQVKGKGSLTMPELTVGDMVLVSAGNFEMVYCFGHRQENLEAEYLQLFPSQLEISKDHMVKIRGRYIPASAVKVGDELETAMGKVVTVERINIIFRKGAYAPFTTSGTIVVCNVKASSYVSFQGTDTLMMGNIKTKLTFQWLAHLSQSPHRTWTHLFGLGEETYTAEGISTWVSVLHQIGLWYLEQDAIVMSILLVPVLMCLLVIYAVEVCVLFAITLCKW